MIDQASTKHGATLYHRQIYKTVFFTHLNFLEFLKISISIGENWRIRNTIIWRKIVKCVFVLVCRQFSPILILLSKHILLSYIFVYVCTDSKWRVCSWDKKWRGTRILHGDMTFSKKLPRVSDGFGILVWRVISPAHNLITVLQTVTRKLHTTLNNICTVLTLTGIELRTPKNPYIQSVMLTFPLHHRGTRVVVVEISG